MLAAPRSDASDLASVGCVSAPPMRIAAVETRLLRDGPASFVLGLEDLLRDVLRRPSRRSTDAAFACAMWLVRDAAPHLGKLREAAVRFECRRAGAILTDAPPHKALAPRGRLPDPSVGEAARLEEQSAAIDLDGRLTPSDPETVFELRSAGEEDATVYVVQVPYRPPFGTIEELEHVHPMDDDVQSCKERVSYRRMRPRPIAVRRREGLVRHSSPFTIRRLLSERALTTKEAVRIASRRPTTPAIVRELTTCLRWMSIPSVREALVMNPFTPTPTALAFLPTLRANVVREIARVANVHAALRGAARLLLDVPQGSGA
jgi:hypothetical protein